MLSRTLPEGYKVHRGELEHHPQRKGSSIHNKIHFLCQRSVKFCFIRNEMVYLNKMNIKGDNDEKKDCVIHVIAAGIIKFTQSKVIAIKQSKKDLLSNPEEPTTMNSALSLLTLAGGSFGKIYRVSQKKRGAFGGL